MTTRHQRLENWMRACRHEHDDGVLAARPHLPLVIGEAPNRDGAGSEKIGRVCEIFATGRLATHGDVARLERTNLLKAWPGASGSGSAFPMKEARPAATVLLRSTQRGRRLLHVGTRVAAAFDLLRPTYGYLNWFEVAWKPHEEGPKRSDSVRALRREVAVVPHPSGLNRWWNDPDNVSQAEAFFKEVYA